MMPKGVLVMGAGVAGIRAALDLADMGVPVHLVEKQPSIGGRMLQIDTVFPTDCHGGCRHCSIGLVSGQPADGSQHPNITLHTYTEVQEVSGSSGSFTVRLLEHARHVDEYKCTTCGKCAEVCPIELPDEFNEGLSQRKAIYRPHAESIPAAYLVSKRGTPPCEAACPAGTPGQGYIGLIAQGRYQEALEVIKRHNPFPATVGRVCDHPWEAECERALVDEPVAMYALERFVADWVYAHRHQGSGETVPGSGTRRRAQPSGKRVAIVGSGPAGLSAAFFLAREGYRPTVFEASPVAGGRMRTSIPTYRLPRHVLQREIDDILSLGVELRLYHPISHMDSLFGEGYEAVLLAIGARERRPLGIPGEDAKGVYDGLAFLEAVNLGRPVSLGNTVVVLGDDNTAIYAARSALRLGAGRVIVASERARDEMRAIAQEVDEAEVEGVRLEYRARPVAIIAEGGQVSGVRLIRGFAPTPERQAGHEIALPAGSELTVDADSVIVSGTYEPETSLVKSAEGLKFGASGHVVVNSDTLETTRPGVFAAGDAVRGPSALIQAIADGCRAAFSIDRYLRGVSLTGDDFKALPRVAHLTEAEAAAALARDTVSSAPRVATRLRPAAERVSTFDEVDLGLTEEQARAEAQRCLNCGICSNCGFCVEVCEEQCIDLQMPDKTVELDVGAIIVATGFVPLDPSDLTPYGYGRIPNVITSLEYERLVNASGPTGGQLLRPSDGLPVKDLAFIQCVGSRDVRHSAFCSSVCCMFGTQEAIVAHRHDPEVRSTIFYRDLRMATKGSEDIVEEALQKHNVRYARARVAEITLVAHERPILWYDDIESGGAGALAVDLVVLVMGLVPRQGAEEMAEVLGIELDENNFVKTAPFLPTDTTRPGVFACGFCRGPADITESVAQASAAAARAAEIVMAPQLMMRG